MKVKELVGKAQDELKDETQELIVDLIKTSLKRVKDAEKTLRLIKKTHEELLESDVDNLELDEYDY